MAKYDPKKAKEISIKGKQVTNAFKAGKDSGLRIARGTTNTGGERFNEFRRPAGGPGGYETVPFDDFGDYRGPTIPNPNPGQGFDWAHHNPDQPDNILNHILYTPGGDIWGVDIPGKGPQPLYTPDGKMDKELQKLIQQEQMKHQKSMMISDTRNLQKGPHPYMTGVDEAVGGYPGRNAPADLRIAPLKRGVDAYKKQKGLV